VQLIAIGRRAMQGEANVGFTNYGCRFKAMISDWRHRFSTDGHSNPLAPFLFVQLAGKSHASARESHAGILTEVYLDALLP